jgi:hypothetical protein
MSDREETRRPSALQPRFSLLTSLLVVTIVAMGIGLWRLYSELVPLRREVISLREQIGVVTVDDENKMQIVEVKQAGSFEWNWHIRLPRGHDYRLYASRSVPEKGVAGRSFNEHRIGTGGPEFNLRVRIAPNEDGKRTAYLRTPQNDHPLEELADSKWLDGRAMVSEEVAGRKSQVSASPDESLVLLRVREASDTPQPMDGLLIWITGKRIKNR